MEVNAKLWMQFITAVSLKELQKVYFVLAGEKGKKRYYNHKKSHSTTSNIYMRQHFQVMSYVWYLRETLNVLLYLE